MKIKTLLLTSVAVVSVVIVGLSLAFPPLDDLWLENPFWNGLSGVYSTMKPNRLIELASLERVVDEPSNSTILMLGPSKAFTAEEVEAVGYYLSMGGRVILGDDYGTGNTLLEGLGVDVRFSGLLLMDALFKDKNSLMPRILHFSPSSYILGIGKLTLNYPTVLNYTEDVTVLAWSTPYSYLADTPQSQTENSPVGPFPVIANVKMGEGNLFLISDSSLFINSMLEREDNMALLRGLAIGEVYLDETHSQPSRLTHFKMYLGQIYSVVRMTEIRYGLTFLLVVVAVKVKLGSRKVEAEENEVEATLREHPEWDRRLLNELQAQRRKARGT